MEAIPQTVTNKQGEISIESNNFKRCVHTAV